MRFSYSRPMTTAREGSSPCWRMLHKKMGDSLGRGLILAGLFGSALLYGDGLITPVISVLSALEGLEVATTSARPVVVPLTCCILCLLFWAQSRGTGRLGKFFGPVMILWFAVIAMFGAAAISRMPEILEAVDPVHAVRFFLNNGLRGFFLLGAVVLCVTGCEALYADMGHFGARAIRLSWYLVALPALLLNYFGQGALILLDPSNAGGAVLRPRPPRSSLSDGSARHDRHDHRLPGYYLRGLLADPAGHSTGLSAAHAGRAHFGNG